MSNEELVSLLSAAVRNERSAAAEVIAQLAELDRRKLYLEAACSSLYMYCIERLGYSEDGALKRVRVARLAQQLPRVLDELRSGAIHLTGLFLLAPHVTKDNADALLADTRGKSRRQIEEVIAQWFPRPDVPERIEPASAPPRSPAGTWPRPGNSLGASSSSPSASRFRLGPLSATSYRVELTISSELRVKIEQLRNLLSHAVPSGDLAQLLERAVDALLEREMRHRVGVGRSGGAGERTCKPRKPRAPKPGSRHVPVDVQRAVRERDANQCTYLDELGRRCSETRFLTIEHDMPYAFGGPPTVDNCRLLCAGHNAHTARHVFGHKQIDGKIAQARQAKKPPRLAQQPAETGPVYDRVLSALVGMGFQRERARRALDAIGPEAEPRVEPLLRAALRALTPA